ncbi:MAG: signal peptidase I [Clostridia bacterium]|nr:signal peptidase I [Clostridia bacterium]
MNNKYFANLHYENINFKQRKSKWIKLLDGLFYTFLVVIACYLIFSYIFIQAYVIGPSMQPTFNKNLTYIDDPETSQYQDIVYVNRFDGGNNGDVILAKANGDVVIKRIIATENQMVVLKKLDDGYFYYFVGDDYESVHALDESYILSRADMNINYFNRFCLENPELENRKNVNVVKSGEEAYIIVPKGCVFILGDNRGISSDSLLFGCIDTDNVIGSVAFSYEYNQTFLGYIWQQICSIF